MRTQQVRLAALAALTLSLFAGPGFAAGLPPMAGPAYDGGDEEWRIQAMERLNLIAVTARGCSSVPAWQVDIMEAAARRALPVLDATALPPMEAARKARTNTIAKSGCKQAAIAADSRDAPLAYGRALVGSAGWIKVTPDGCLPSDVDGAALRGEIDRLVAADKELADDVTAWRTSMTGKQGCAPGANGRPYAADVLTLFQRRPGAPAFVTVAVQTAPKPAQIAVAPAPKPIAAPVPAPAPRPVVQAQPPSAPGEQTPQNAQLFLRTVIQQGGTKILINAEYKRNWASYNEYRQPSCQSNCPVELPRDVAVFDMGSVGVCATDLTFQLPTFVDYQYVNDAVSWKWENFPVTPNRYRIDWKKVAKATVNGNQVTLSGIPRLHTFVLPSPELAKRVGFAMEFLRLHCDPTAATGF